MRKTRLLVLLTTFIVESLLCACQGVRSDYPEISEQEVEKERLIQQDLAAKSSLEKQEKQERRHLEMEQRLVRVGQRVRQGGMDICKAIKGKVIDECIYTFELTEENRQLNAYADGKKIYVTPTMMRFTKSDDELAVVMGHEYAHNLMEHSKSKKSNMVVGNILGFAVDMLASYQGVSTGGAFSDIGTNVGALSYTQSFEKEADYVGLYVTALSGYNINSAPGFWRRMSLKDNRSIVESTTHPTTPERFVMLKKVVEEISLKQKKKQPLLPELKKKKDQGV